MKKILAIIFIVSSFTRLFSQENTYDNLIFEGAGILGLAYSGAIHELESDSIIHTISKVGGTSSGAITALTISLGYSAEEIYSIISETEFQKFNDKGFARMNSKFGWYKGDKFSQWLENIIKNKTGNEDITFEELIQLGYKDLYVTGTCLNKQKLIIFSAETYPNMKIKDAVRISMSIPLYYEAIFIDSVGNVYKNPSDIKDLDIVVDGGILANYPIFIFDSIAIDSLDRELRIPNSRTLGVRIDSDLQIESDSSDRELVPIEISGFSDYVEAFYLLIHENLNRSILIEEDWTRTISVSSAGIGPRVRKLSDDQKNSLIVSGERCTRTFLDSNRQFDNLTPLSAR